MSIQQRVARLERRWCDGRAQGVVTFAKAVRRLHEAGLPFGRWPWMAQAYAQARMEFRDGAWCELEGGKERP
jgi:hypothetical protein